MTKPKRTNGMSVEFTEGVVTLDGEVIGNVSYQLFGWRWIDEDDKESDRYFLDSDSAAKGLVRHIESKRKRNG